MRRTTWIAALGIVAVACGRDTTAPASPNPEVLLDRRGEEEREERAVGRVYTQTNTIGENEVLVFARSSNGQLRPAGRFETDGSGTGAGLGSQGAVVLSGDGRWLFAVNAGTNSITSFRVTSNGLERASVVSSGGTRPISVTWRRGLLFALNAGGSGNITGFEVGKGGALHPLPGSTRPLSSSASDPAQVGFSPRGRLLVVTEKATNKITTYTLDGDGRPSAPIVNASAGQTPFGFTFDHKGRLIVSEAFGGAPNASAASSYHVEGDGTIQVLSASVPTTETAACWFVVTRNGRFAYTTNTGSASVSGYAVTAAGRLELLDADGRTGETGAGPIDAALSDDSKFLYTLNVGSRSISAFRIGGGTGALSSVGTVGDLPPGSVGLAAH